MKTIPLFSRNSHSRESSGDIGVIATYREGDRPLAPGEVDMPWPDIEEPGRLAAPQGEAQVVPIEGQVHPALVAAAVAIQDELDHPALPVAPLEVLAPEELPGPSRCRDTLRTCGSAVVALGAAASAIVGGVLAFTAEDQQAQGEGLMALGVGMGVLVTWCLVGR